MTDVTADQLKTTSGSPWLHYDNGSLNESGQDAGGAGLNGPIRLFDKNGQVRGIGLELLYAGQVQMDTPSTHTPDTGGGTVPQSLMIEMPLSGLGVEDVDLTVVWSDFDWADGVHGKVVKRSICGSSFIVKFRNADGSTLDATKAAASRGGSFFVTRAMDSSI